MKKHIGDLIIKKNDKRDFTKLEEVTGSVSVHEGAIFTANALTTVTDCVYVRDGATFTANALTTTSYVNVREGATFTANALTTTGSVYVREGATFTANALTTVTYTVDVREGAIFTANALTSVSGYVNVREGAIFTANALTSVTGSVYVYKGAMFTAKKLITVTGYVYVSEDAKLNVKFLKKINYKIADRKVFIIESEKTSKGIKIYSGFDLRGVMENKIVKQTTIYLAEKDGFFAHGETVKKSVEDLEFKIVCEKLIKEPIKKNTILTIQYYRLLTGACELGVKEWMSDNKIEEGITAIKLLPILKKTNAYGLENFKKLINF